MKLKGALSIEEYTNALKLGALKGAAVGFAASALGFVVLKRKTGFFNQAGGYHRVIFYVGPATFCAVVQMERQSRQFEEMQVEREQGLVATPAITRTGSTWDRIKEFSGEHKYQLVTAGWAASMIGSFWAVNRDKIMTKSQKIVQARVYAQTLTVLLLLGTVFLSVTEPKDDKKRALEQSKSWEKDLKFVEGANRNERDIVEKGTVSPKNTHSE